MHTSLKNRVFSSICSIAFAAFANGQVTVSVDLLDPSETSGTIPSNLKVVDVFVDVAATDTWIAAGLRVVTSGGARLRYFEGDANRPIIQPTLFNPGIENKFLTSASRPRSRDEAERFTNAGAAAAGGYNPPVPTVTMTQSELSVSYFQSPLPTSTSPSVDGFIARIAIDIANISFQGNPTWGLGVPSSAPQGANIVLLSVPPPNGNANPGTASATFDDRSLVGLDWAMWWVIPEPGTFGMLVVAGLLMRRCR